MNRKSQNAGLTPIILSTTASLSVCVLLVAFATDDQPSAMMNWGNLEEAQMMDNYQNAVTAGDSHLVRANSHHTLDLSQPGRHSSPGMKSAHVKRSSMQEAVKELKHLKQVSASVWPSSKPVKHSTQTAAQLLAHYRRISANSLPKSAFQQRSVSHAVSAGQELAEFKKLSDEVIPSHTPAKHDSWHQSASQMLAHYKQMSENAMPRSVHQQRKPAQTAEQELAHLKRVSAKVFPSHSLHSLHAKARPSQIRRRISAPLPAKSKQHFAVAPATSEPSRATGAVSTPPSTRTIAGGLQITDVKVGSGPEPEVGENIKVCLPEPSGPLRLRFARRHA